MIDSIFLGFILLSGYVCSLPSDQQNKEPEFVCAYYEKKFCSLPENFKNSKCLLKQEVCEPKEREDKRQHCYAFYHNETGVLTDVKKGCWLNANECYDKMTCSMRSVGRGNHFCCCDSPMCNLEVFHSNEPYIEPTIKPTARSAQVVGPNRHSVYTILCVSLLPILCIAIVIIISFLVYKRMCPNGIKRRCFNMFKTKGGPHKQHLTTPMLNDSISTSDILSNSIAEGVSLMEVKAVRQFGGSVKRGKMGDRMVAVKIFAAQEKSSWVKETEFYRLNYIKNENILNFITSVERKNSLNKAVGGSGFEYWIITEFHERGSLYDLLKSTSLTWAEALKVATSASKGLSFLHSKVVSSNNCCKPQIAHRDIKSRNILIKSDMTACIADFGLALILNANMGEAHCQVGTPRYMSPEVIDASIDCSMDNFLKIDVYAFGLVLWEIVSRCTEANGGVSEYKLPFEAELGQHPSIGDMQKAVVLNRSRPLIKSQWRQHKGISLLCQSMEELWDQDPEARNSMPLICDRLESLCTLA